MSALAAQFRTECTLTLRNKESLLLTLGIPVGLLVFFSLVDVLPLDDVLPAGGDPVDVLAPGVLALAIMSMAMTGLAIATGFERSYGVLKRLGTTPLGRPRLLAAKIGAVVAIEAIQAAVLIPVGLALGLEPVLVGSPPRREPSCWAPRRSPASVCGWPGTLRAEITLALANGLYLVLLLLGGFLIPLVEFPDALRVVAEALPASALADLVTAGFSATGAPGRAWVGAGRVGRDHAAGRRQDLPLGAVTLAARRTGRLAPPSDPSTESGSRCVPPTENAFGVRASARCAPPVVCQNPRQRRARTLATVRAASPPDSMAMSSARVTSRSVIRASRAAATADSSPPGVLVADHSDSSRAAAGVEVGLDEVPRLRPRPVEQVQAQRLGRPALQQVHHEHEVAGGLGHLLAVVGDGAHMHPRPGERA